MNRYVKIKYNGKVSSYLLCVDENYVWSDDQIKSENAKAVEVAKMAFLDHGDPLIPIDVLPAIEETKAAYLNKPAKGTVLLVSEGGTFMTLLPGMEILEEKKSKFYPIEPGAAIACENDPFDKYRGGVDHVFENLAKIGGAESFHYMFNFRNRMESEVIEAFKKAPAIVFWSSYKDVDWWELMIRCIIKSKSKAKVVGKQPSGYAGGQARARYEKFKQIAEKFGVNIITV